uniref:Uncharacterized protein n=1 Tax=Anguilla anguilla TaxID=7936 RepID=A0A0E9PLY4_ANGAN
MVRTKTSIHRGTPGLRFRTTDLKYHKKLYIGSLKSRQSASVAETKSDILTNQTAHREIIFIYVQDKNVDE